MIMKTERAALKLKEKNLQDQRPCGGRKLQDTAAASSSSQVLPKLRKVGSKKAKEKSEIEFAIKNHKKAKLKSGNKFTPLRRRLRARKNFKYFNEQ